MDVKRLLGLGCRSSSRIGIGLTRPSFDETRQRLRRSKCNIRLSRYDSARNLVSALRRGEVDAAVRGTLSSIKVVSELRAQFNHPRIIRAALLETSYGKPFILAPVGIDEGKGFRARLEVAEQSLDYFSRAGWKLSVGVLSFGRAEDKDRGPEIRRSLEEGERLTKRLNSRGREATHYQILVEDAAREEDLLLAPDGVTGNLIFRTLHFVGGGKAYGAPVVNLDGVFVDTSRAKSDFSEAVLLAAGLAVVRSGSAAKT